MPRLVIKARGTLSSKVGRTRAPHRLRLRPRTYANHLAFRAYDVERANVAACMGTGTAVAIPTLPAEADAERAPHGKRRNYGAR